MSLTATFDPQLSRVRLAGTSLSSGVTATFERSLNQVKWTTVRGGTAVTISGSDTASLDDYEFVPGVVNYYRVSDDSNTYTANVSPSQSGVWIKSITRPFLNRSVTVVNYSDITIPAKNGIFEIVGRSFPVAVVDVRSSRRWTMNIKCDSVSDADALEVVLASGDPLFIQTDGLHDIPDGYVVVGDANRSRYGTISDRRYFDLPMTAVAAPGPDVVGSTATWETLIAEFGTWSNVLAEFGTWAEVADWVADPNVVVVP
jgi:hypothetical protein